MKEYEYLNQYEINILKRDLMAKNNDLETLSSLISTEVNDIINDERGNNLEENIRKTVENEFEWKISQIPRAFFYKKITVNNEDRIIYKYKCISLTVKENIFFLKFNDKNNSCEVYKNDFKKLNQKIKEKPKMVEINIGNYQLKVWPMNKIEIDGIYEINGIDLSLFPRDEFNIIYNNINDDEKQSFELAAIEVKLSIKKMKELVTQLQKDFDVLGKITDRKMVFIGIVNSSSVSFNYKEYVKHFNCLILGIKNSIVCERKVIAPIDWNLVTEFRIFKKETENKIASLKDDVKELKDEVKGLKEDIKCLKCLKDDFNKMKNDISIIKTYMQISNNGQNFLKKKRRRWRKKQK